MFLFYFLIGVGLLVLLWLALRWFVEAKPQQLVTALRWMVGIGGGLGALYLVATGRAGSALMVAAALAPLFMRWKALLTMARNAAGPTPGSVSQVETAWLRMSLDHDTGSMDGTVLEGAFKGRRLGELAPDALIALLTECRVNDGEAAALLEAYLDHTRPDWRAEAGEKAAAGGGGRGSAPSAAMTREEAYRILGLAPGADDKAIREAHKRLMMKLHPDQGGSTYLAAKINQAKDLLVGG
ncbi:MAG: DnaJ domain-containing protein [Pseudomonadota bacterium]